MSAVIVWFRQDLRIKDHPPLQAAMQSGKTVIPLYIWDEETPGLRSLGGAHRWWLHHSLEALDISLQKIGSCLILKRGKVEDILKDLIRETDASSLYWSRCYEPCAIARDQHLKQLFREKDVDVKSFNSTLLFEPWTIQNQARQPYKVFSQFWKTCLKNMDALPALSGKLNSLKVPLKWPSTETLQSLKLLPTQPNWAIGFSEYWTPGEEGAVTKLRDFIDGIIDVYKHDRNYPAVDATSRLSPHLHFGEISPLQILRALQSSFPTGFYEGPDCFLKELGWREFSHHLLYHFPSLPSENFKSEFNHFEWDNNPEYIKKWQKGLTGYPIVDAGMRQLWQTGWMHNRVRMIVASFLTKDLFASWQIGEEWFWDTLVDANQANNASNWQWVAGCGADAAPFFRIFNPVLQGEKFDADGEYIKLWVPELEKLPSSFIHKPWKAPALILQAAGIELGKTYPYPLVQHEQVRVQALERYQNVKIKNSLLK